MVDYSQGKIYKILNTINDDVYVGSTTQSLAKRMSWHRRSINCKTKPYAIYNAMKEYGVDNFYIELIENISCQTKEELRAREGYYIRKIGTLNKCIAGRSRDDWVKENIEKINEGKLKWYSQNKEHKRNYEKQRIANNREAHLESRHNYYIQNKATIQEKQNERIQCVCGLDYRRSDKSQHYKSKRHIDRIKELN